MDKNDGIVKGIPSFAIDLIRFDIPFQNNCAFDEYLSKLDYSKDKEVNK